MPSPLAKFKKYNTHKYNAIPVTIDGIKFASKKEGRRYVALKAEERAGAIQALTLQPRFKLKINGTLIATYVADFAYMRDGKQVIEDVKGVKTRVYKMKRKMMKAIYGIDIYET
jgi:hypothetical protein